MALWMLACASEPSSAASARGTRPVGLGEQPPLAASVPPVGASSAGAPGAGPTGEPLVVAPGGQAGAAGNAEDRDCGVLREMAKGAPGPVDIVWIIDGSGSMRDEHDAIQQNIAGFAAQIGGAGIDYHVVMVAEDDVAAGTALSADPSRYLYVRARVGSHDAFQVLLETQPNYASFLRPDSALHFVVVTDDESRMSAPAFRQQMEQRVSKPFVAHAIVSENVNGDPCVGACGVALVCGAAAPGLQYEALSDATGGLKVSICSSDWSKVFEPLKQAVITSAPLPCDYAIPPPPGAMALDPGRVNVSVLERSGPPTLLKQAQDAQHCGTAAAWYYDSALHPQRIGLCPAACQSLRAGGGIELTFGCATIPLQ